MKRLAFLAAPALSLLLISSFADPVVPEILDLRSASRVVGGSEPLSDSTRFGFDLAPEDFGAKGDGVANDTAALTAVFATGKSIRFAPGKIYLSNELTVAAGTKIRGSGATIRARTGTTGELITLADDATDIDIEGLTLDADGLATYGIFAEGSSARRIKIRNNHIIDPTLDGVRIRQGIDIDITGNTIDTPGQHGITITAAASDFAIDFNTINNPGGAGIIFSQGLRGSIIGNFIDQPGPNGDGVTGYITSNEDVIVANNVVKNTANAGMHLAGTRISVTGNLIDTSTREGILFGGTDNGTAGSTASDSFQSTISNNIVRSAGSYGISFTLVQDSAISGNVVSNATDYGFRFALSDRNAITGNNSSDGTAGGYILEGSTHNVLSGNFSYSNASDGFRITQSVTGPTQSVYNVLSGNFSDSDDRGFIEANSSDNNHLLNNRITNNVSTTQIRAGAASVFENAPLYGTATYDPASLGDGVGATTIVTVTGAAVGDRVEAAFSNALSDVLLLVWISAADTVSVRFQNESGGTRDLSNGAIRVWVTKQ